MQLLPPTTRSLLTALMIAGFPREHTTSACTLHTAHCMHSETPWNALLQYFHSVGVSSPQFSVLVATLENTPLMFLSSLSHLTIHESLHIWREVDEKNAKLISTTSGFRPLQTFDRNQYFICQLPFSTRLHFFVFNCALHCTVWEKWSEFPMDL